MVRQWFNVLAPMLVLGALAHAQVPQTAVVANHTTQETGQVPDAYLATVRQWNILLGHQSVGQNLSYGGQDPTEGGGIQDLAALPGGRYALTLRSNPSLADLSGGIWGEFYVGTQGHVRGNPGPTKKLADFQTTLLALGSKVKVAFFKFCYVDFGGQFHPGMSDEAIAEDMFIRYRDQMLALEAAHPNTHFIWTTCPLSRRNPPPQYWNLAGNNTRRYAFNQRIRQYVQEHPRYLLDIADLQCRYVDAQGQVTHYYDASGDKEYIAPQYCSTSAPPHPNTLGAERLSRAIWYLLARMAGWNGQGESSPTLQIQKLGSGSGTVTSLPAGIACGGDCSRPFPAGTPITLSAQPAPGHTFLGWSNGPCSGTGDCTFTLEQNTTITAHFQAPAIAPDVQFSASPVAGTAPLVVAFTPLNVGGEITRWLWQFGDGATATEPNPVHTYTTPGTFDVRLEVQGPGGTDVETRTACITVQPPSTTVRILTESFPGATKGQPYACFLQAGGGSTPYVWSKSAGTFPPGLGLAVYSGKLHGTPTTSGSWTFTLQVKDAQRATDTRTYTLTVGN